MMEHCQFVLTFYEVRSDFMQFVLQKCSIHIRIETVNQLHQRNKNFELNLKN